MRRYILITILLGAIAFLIYISGVYFVKAEHSFKQLAQKTEELGLEKTLPEEDIQNQPAKQELPPNVITIMPEKETAETAPAEQTKPAGPPSISMEFENANLRDVLKIFCQQSGLNFVAGENIQMKPVTLYLNNVSVDDALNTIIKANGLAYEKAQGSNIFIVTRTAEPEIKKETKIFKLKYAFAEDKSIMGVENTQQTIKGIKESIQKLLTPNGDLSVDPRTNSLIITDIPTRFDLIEKSIKELDSNLPQLIIEAKIVELGTTDLDQLGVKWSSLAGYTIKLQDPTRTYESERTSGDDHTDEYTTETTRDVTDELVYSVLGGTASDTTTIEDTTSTGHSLADTFTRTLTRSDLRSAILTADDFQITLSLLLTNTNVDVISNPSIVTSHSKEAKITIGEQYPIPQFTYNSSTAAWEVSGFEYRDIGIILRVTPYADTEKSVITLELRPEVSDIAGYSSFRGIDIPIIATRTAITNVEIKDGETLAIGGLLKDRDNTVTTKVPVLGDIPILGRLFSHKEATKTKTNMIIFITPHIMKEGEGSIPIGMGQEVTVPVPMAIPIPQNVTKPVAEKSTISEKQKFTHR